MSPSATLARSLHDLAQVGDARAGRAHRLEGCVARAGDECRKRRLAAPGRTPEDQRRHLPRIDGTAQHGPDADRAVLADELLERPRPHPRRQRRVAPGVSGSVRADRVCAEERTLPGHRRRSAQLRGGRNGDDRRRLEPGRVAENAAQHLRRTEQPRRLRGHHQLGVGALGELGQRVQLEDRDQCRIRRGRLDGSVHGRDRLGAALSFEDRCLPVAFCAKDRRLPLAFRLLDRGLPVTVGDVDRRLLLTFRLQDPRALLLVRLLLQGHRLEDLHRRGDVDDLDAVDADAPLVGDLLHLLLHRRVDLLARRQRLVEADVTERITERRAGLLVDGDEVVRHIEQCRPRLDDLAEDRRVDRDGNVVARDHVLTVTGSWRLAHVDPEQLVDERGDDRQTGLGFPPKSSKTCDHAGESLRHDADRAADEDRHDDEQDDDDDRRDQTAVVH